TSIQDKRISEVGSPPASAEREMRQGAVLGGGSGIVAQNTPFGPPSPAGTRRADQFPAWSCALAEKQYSCPRTKPEKVTVCQGGTWPAASATFGSLPCSCSG